MLAVSRCLDPQTPSEKAFRGPNTLLTMYAEDFGRLGIDSELDLELQSKEFTVDGGFSKSGPRRGKPHRKDG